MLGLPPQGSPTPPPLLKQGTAGQLGVVHLQEDPGLPNQGSPTPPPLLKQGTAGQLDEVPLQEDAGTPQGITLTKSHLLIILASFLQVDKHSPCPLYLP